MVSALQQKVHRQLAINLHFTNSFTKVAPNGRVFYINHAEKKTTWVDPRSGRPSQLPSANNVPNRRHEDDLGPLPEGWEERVHTDGRIFFIDHNTRATQVRQTHYMAKY